MFYQYRVFYRPVSSERPDTQTRQQQQQQTTFCADTNSKLIEPDSMYLDNLEQHRLNGSGDTSAYCTSESRKSQNDSLINDNHSFTMNSNENVNNNNNNIISSNHTTNNPNSSNGSLIDQRFNTENTSSNVQYPTKTISHLHYNENNIEGGIAASLSDLGGSLLSLSAILPEAHHYRQPYHHNPHPHHHHHHSRQYNSSEVHCTNNHHHQITTSNDSFSPSSNWSIDGNSQYTTHSNQISNKYSHPDLNIHYTESYYTPIRQFDSPVAATVVSSISTTLSSSSSITSSRNHHHHHHHHHHESSNEQLPSTSDNNNNNHNLKVNNTFDCMNDNNSLNEQKRHVNFTKDILCKSNMKFHKSDYYHQQQLLHNANCLSEQNSQKCLMREDNSEKSPSLNQKLKTKTIDKYLPLYPSTSTTTTSLCCCNECLNPLTYQMNHLSSMNCMPTTTLNEKEAEAAEEEILTKNIPIHTITSMHNQYKTNQQPHSYEFYDNFCCALTNRITLNSSEQQQQQQHQQQQRTVNASSALCHQPLTHFNESINMEKTNLTNGEPILSDIYETPYASVTIHDEPINEQHPPKHISINSCNAKSSLSTNRTEDNSHLLLKPNYWSPITNANNLPFTNENSSHSKLFNPYLYSVGYLDYVTNNPLIYPHPLYTSATCHTKQLHNATVNTTTTGGVVSSSSSTAALSTITTAGLPPSGQVYPMDNWNMMEWVVKKRPDGTRYITRRPIR
ncbi:unnamed protein product [Schistosoma turkestanicum]|nr:unnamed protein product [Schistosoma turkestanicum]